MASDFKVDRVGYYRRRDGGVAYVGAFAPFDAEYSAAGWEISDSTWDVGSWTCVGEYYPGYQHDFDLVAYIGETLRKLPDSPGWWWYECKSGRYMVMRVVEEHGQLCIWSGGGPASEAPGRWGDKIEPSGFDDRKISNESAKAAAYKVAEEYGQ